MARSFEQPHSHTIMLALVASLLLHASMVLVSFRLPATLVVSSDLSESLNTKLVRLGDSKPSPVQVTWLGSTQETEHEAPEASTDQMEQAIGGDAGELNQPVEQPSPKPDNQAESAESETHSDTPPVQPVDLRLAASARVLEQELTQTADVVSTLAEQIALTFREQIAAAQERMQQEQADAAREQAEAQRQAQEAARAAAQAASASSSADDTNGNSDRESDATSQDKPIRIKPGEPLNAEGIRLATRKPKFTMTTRVSARPANPIVEITFGHDGDVVRKGVRFVGRGTGYAEVDQPLIEAMYLWTASGARIDKLKPGETVSMTILVILN